MTTGQMLKEFRVKAGWTQAEAAKMTGCTTQGMWANYEADRRAAPISLIKAFIRVLYDKKKIKAKLDEFFPDPQ